MNGLDVETMPGAPVGDAIGIKMESPSGFECYRSDTRVGWVMVAKESDPQTCETYLYGRWMNAENYSVTHRIDVGYFHHLFDVNSDVYALVDHMVAKVEKRFGLDAPIDVKDLPDKLEMVATGEMGWVPWKYEDDPDSPVSQLYIDSKAVPYVLKQKFSDGIGNSEWRALGVVEE